MEDAKAAIEQMKSDEAFRDRIMAGENVEERLRQICDSGFDCTAEELEQLPRELLCKCNLICSVMFCLKTS